MLNSDIRIDGIGPRSIAPELNPQKLENEAGAGSFKDVLRNLVDHVDNLQGEADVSIRGLATGETTDIHDVTVKMEEAGVAFDLMMEIRNKLLEAYQQIMKMQS